MTQYNLFATVPKGIESLLNKELKQLGAVKFKKVRAGVSFVGSLEYCYVDIRWRN